MWRPIGDRRGIGIALFHLAVAALEGRDYGQVRAPLTELLPLSRDIGHQVGVADGLEILAAAAALEGRAGRAVRLWAAAGALHEAGGSQRMPRARRYEPHIAAMRAELGEAACVGAVAAGRAMTPEQAVAYALADAAEDSAPPSAPATPPAAAAQPLPEPLTPR